MKISINHDILKICLVNEEMEYEYNLSQIEKEYIHIIYRDRDKFYPYAVNVEKTITELDIVVLRIFIAKNQDIYLYSEIPVEYSGDEAQQENIEQDFVFRKKVIEMFPEHKKKVDAINNRIRVSHELTPNTSLAAIDAQLELLTDMIFRIIDSHPELIPEQNEYNSFKAAWIDTSLLKIKSREKILDEISDKRNIRKIQEKYYEIKNTKTVD